MHCERPCWIGSAQTKAMTARWAATLALVCFVVAKAQGPAAAGPLGDIKERAPRSAILDLASGFGWQIAPGVQHQREELSHDNGGLAFSAGLRMRTSYFLSPFVDV